MTAYQLEGKTYTGLKCGGSCGDQGPVYDMDHDILKVGPLRFEEIVGYPGQ